MCSAKGRKRWAFTAVSPGLVVHHGAAGCLSHDMCSVPNTVSKPVANNELFDVDGKLLSEDASQAASTWRSHHAFSARCEMIDSLDAERRGSVGTAVNANGGESGAAVMCVDHASDVPAWRRTMDALREQYRSWEAVFQLSARSRDGQPNMLLSVAPRYVPYVTAPDAAGAEGAVAPESADLDTASLMASSEEQQRYDARVLETPLIWEEPLTLSVECSARGVFLWSDHWTQYGAKLADRCFTRRPLEGEGGGGAMTPTNAAAHNASGAAAGDLYEAAVRLRWSLSQPTSAAETPSGVLSVALGVPPSSAGGSDATAQEKAATLTWLPVAEHSFALTALAREAVFLPHVTLMEKHDTATIY